MLQTSLLWRVLADASRLLNRLSGGEKGRTVCWRIAMAYGPDCAFCRFIAALLRDPDHCRSEMSAQDLWAWLKRRK